MTSISEGPNGNVYAFGYTQGAISGQTNIGELDWFILKLNPEGLLLDSRQFGTVENDISYDISIDASGNIYLAGTTNGAWGGPAKGRQFSAGGITFSLPVQNGIVVKLDSGIIKMF